MRLNRRQPYRSDLRGSFPDRIVEIVCVFDTSGSMSKEDLTACMNEVFNITKSFNTIITVIECDTRINNIYTVKKSADIRTEMKGRGGTYFTPAIEYINGDSEFCGRSVPKGRYRNALMVYFTDGYGEREIPKPLTHRNLWVIMNDEKNLSVREPYGKVVSIEPVKRR
jgi:predicted metal-dependent peptidase